MITRVIKGPSCVLESRNCQTGAKLGNSFPTGSLDDCRQKCIDEPECRLTSFGLTSNTCRMFKECRQMRFEVNSAVVWAKCPGSGSGCFFTDMRLKGKPNRLLPRSRRVKDPFECQRRCAFFRKCVFWTVRMTSKCNTCQLYRKYVGDEMSSGSISGPKRCPNPMEWIWDSAVINAGDVEVIRLNSGVNRTLDLLEECGKRCKDSSNCK